MSTPKQHAHADDVVRRILRDIIQARTLDHRQTPHWDEHSPDAYMTAGALKSLKSLRALVDSYEGETCLDAAIAHACRGFAGMVVPDNPKTPAEWSQVGERVEILTCLGMMQYASFTLGLATSQQERQRVIDYLRHRCAVHRAPFDSAPDPESPRWDGFHAVLMELHHCIDAVSKGTVAPAEAKSETPSKG